MMLLNVLREKPLLYDGSKGVVLQSMGLTSGELGEVWNIARPEKVCEVYQRYRAAGSDVLQTNTFSANRSALRAHGMESQLEAVNTAGVRLARDAADGAFVAASAGPTGRMSAPFGDLTFREAYEIFAEQARILEDAGADAIHFETFMDLSEIRAAILAAKENTHLPVIASMALEASGKTLMGVDADVCAKTMEVAGADVIGVNCSCGPQSLLVPVEEMAAFVSVPVIAKPNAGLPETVDGVSVYRQTPEEFATQAAEFLSAGVHLLGGCCGTTPEFIAALRPLMNRPEKRPAKRQGIFLCAASGILDVSEPYYSETIDASGDPDDFLEDAQDAGEDVLVLDFGGGVSYDVEAMTAELCSVVRTPIAVKGDPNACVSFLRCYPGVAGVIPDNQNTALLERYGVILQK